MMGHILGHYKLEEQLGAGAMGVVYRAADSLSIPKSKGLCI